MASMIWCQDLNGAIGKDNKLLWHIPEDLQYFKKITMNHPVIMGRKTWESLPFKPLPHRFNAIVSKNFDLSQVESIPLDSLRIYPTPEQAIVELPSSFIIGGGTLYNYLLNPELSTFELIDSLYITMVHDTIQNADTFAPKQEFIDQYFRITKKDTQFLIDKNTNQELEVDFIKFEKK